MKRFVHVIDRHIVRTSQRDNICEALRKIQRRNRAGIYGMSYSSVGGGIGGGADDHRVLVSPSDTAAGYLYEKLAIAGGATGAIDNPAGDEDYKITVHAQAHALASDTALGADHTITGGVLGYVLRCLTGTTAKLMQLLHSDLGSIGANDHHAQAHVLATNTALGTDHTITGGVLGYVLKALTATTAKFMQLTHAELGTVTADQHHAQSHVLATTAGLGAYHTTSGLTARQMLRATAAAVAAFQTPDIRASELAGGTVPRIHLAQNLIPDGAFAIVQGSAMPFWAGAYGTGVTITRITSDAVVGGACLQISRNTTNTGGILVQFRNEDGYEEYLPVSASRQYRVWLSTKLSGALNGNRVQMVVHCYDRTKAFISSLTPIDVNPPGAAWGSTQADVGTGALAWPANTTYCRVEVRDVSTNAAAVNLVGLAIFSGQAFATTEDHGHGAGAAGGALTPGTIGDRLVTSAAGLTAWYGGVAIKNEDWEDITDWTSLSGGTFTIEENPAGQLHLLAGDAAGADSTAAKYINSLAPHCQEATLEILVKFDVLAGGFDGTTAKYDVFQVTFANGVYSHNIYFTSDSVWYQTGAATYTSQFATAFDNASWYRFRILYGPNYAMIWSSDDGAAWVYQGCCINAVADATNDGRVIVAVLNYPTLPVTTEVHVDTLTLIAGHYTP